VALAGAAAAQVEHHRLGRLVGPVAADDADRPRASFGLVLDDAELRLGVTQQRHQLFEHVSGHG
jgi:hypothetical protein